ncbi:hypothetical protein CHAB381_1388 [Campylobacter hominis ATCC BAA-381]|uniref:Uncharacterized protein n=1 Tax=Campylobacter hominis (strain ATCC BAA-381 / DSM 21671 / CCUG 45161 / LMG 19568 / NCTC 13146 / CH001A) TaxID=360107 RepID=A7I347_CAMHC|nr:hypothetical protein CHAB381_1388 [Campylobacter hominis ATCC BAA-381]
MIKNLMYKFLHFWIKVRKFLLCKILKIFFVRIKFNELSEIFYFLILNKYVKM